MSRDKLFSDPLNQIDAFAFDDKVATVFPDMINRSVPGYGTMVSLAGVLAADRAQADSTIYDLGCSLGATTAAIASRLGTSSCRIIAVDNSESMLARCQQNLAELGLSTPIETCCEDIRNISIDNASVVSLILTLQFLPTEDRMTMINSIYNGLNSGGMLLLAEKVNFDDASQQQFHTHNHEAFKRANGYSELEISQKRSALENVLVTETARQHEQRLRDAGFSIVHCWYQAFNFMAWAAIK
ncbi:MAG: carboxy-S-adenosyl-L-methionine synthase CmoA [Proteobacteria bacterium]|nr:carboxy-S-adenosyl-L-methionine synthase CmoA [Pseudomonadota bacterium]